MKKKKIVVAILPALNLENGIKDIVLRTKKYVDFAIVVSDGSTDNTRKNALEVGAKCPIQKNIRGMGNAIRKGIEFSKQFLPNIIVLIDADGQHLPEEIPHLINPILFQNYDFIIGSRMMGELKTSFINKIGNFGLKLITFVLLKKWFSDSETGFRAYKAEKLYSLKLISNGYEIETDILFRSMKRGYTFKEVPIFVPKAVRGVKITDGFKMGFFKIKLYLKLRKCDSY
ncbi:glycosyltransferase family 2 protein [Candidatus Lokiarchaeum ossiferum]|uniref:glycosyltransferase family 2 protein n=1 Tax=Candidatus Lokiarchaeum ossiferum TaxID=2951803 RepID=UPI00352D7430